MLDPMEPPAPAASTSSDVQTPIEQVSPLSVDQAIQTLKLIKVRAEAETAEYQKRLAMQQLRPCKLYPILMYHDGLRWVCSYGVFGREYLAYLPDRALGQSGVEAYGNSPEEALQNFDAMWIGTLAEELEEEDGEPDDCPD